jgi:hypothetical protein
MLTHVQAEQVARLYMSAQRAHNHAVIVEANALLNEYLEQLPLPQRMEEIDRLLCSLFHNKKNLGDTQE